MEPIPLRTLTVLLNYERMVSDPRFHGERILESSLASPSVLQRVLKLGAHLFENEPATIKQRHINQFENFDEHSNSEIPSAICMIHPNAGPETQTLTFANRELIYYETHSHDGCFMAIGLYQFFFELCPPGQELSIQISKENPVLVKAYDRSIVEFLIQGPRFHTIVVIASKPLSLISGNVDNSVHAVISFPRPGGDPTDHFVVNMSRTQYGNSGRGTYGETYFLGTWDQYTDSMMATEEEKKICDDFTDIRRSHEMNMQPGANRDRLEACAKRVCERWQNREAQGWCAYCGKGGKLLRCSWCKTAKVWYCCKEYQVSDRKLHKHTCEGIKT